MQTGSRSDLISRQGRMATDTPVSNPQQFVAPLRAPRAAEYTEMEEDEVVLLDLLIVLAERKRLILWITAGSAIAALIVSLLLPKRYTATASLLTPQQNSSLSAQLAS